MRGLPLQPHFPQSALIAMTAALQTPAALHLTGTDPDWATLIALVGPCALDADAANERSTREPYEALVRSIAYQQLHGKAAETILGRFLTRFPDTSFPDAAQVLATDATVMRACGFSASKVAAIHEIANKTLAGVVPTRAEAITLTDEELIARITTLRGVGRWTVEILLIFTLSRPDVLPVDDFGVREGWRHQGAAAAAQTEGDGPARRALEPLSLNSCLVFVACSGSVQAASALVKEPCVGWGEP